MNPLFAQVSEYAPPATINSWLECLFWFAGFVAALGVAYRCFRPVTEKDLPQPLQIIKAPRLATHEELQQLRREFEKSQGDMARQISDQGKDNERRVKDLHNRIEEIPEKIVRLLRDTKGLL